MKKEMSLLLLVFLPLLSFAQNYYPITKLHGKEQVRSNTITVTTIGKPSTGGGTCGVNDYRIGYKEANGYKYSFIEPVKKIRIQITGIQSVEKILININGQKYLLTEEQIMPFNGNCMNVPKASVLNGELISQNEYSNAEILIDYSKGIESIEVLHANGKGAGAAFNIAIVEDNNAGGGVSSNSASTGISETALQPGMFTMLPNPATETFRLAFLPSSSGNATVTITDMAGRKVQVQNYDCSKGVANTHSFNVAGFVPGNYTVDLNLNEEHYVQKLVKL